MDLDAADFLIVGGGSAGAVVAARLSEDPSARVVLVEAGQDTPPGAVPADIADTFPGSYANRSYSWGLQAKGVVGSPPRPFTQARVMGGGSSLMGMWAQRGVPADYDGWAARGATGWAWDDVLPYFCKLERDLDVQGNAHGADGPVPIRRVPRGQWPAFAYAIEQAAATRGYPLRPDLNGAEDEGFFPIAFSQDAGVRASSAHCYLTEAVRRRPNLQILPHTRATAVRFDGARATGVRARRSGGADIDLAAHNVILCGGAIHSPTLLMRSGIGPADALRQLGISVVRDLSGVGANLQNHVFIHIGVTVARGARQSAALRNYGIAAMRFSSGLKDCPHADLMVSAIGRISTGLIGTRAGIVTAKLYAPLSRGAVRLASSDPDTPPDIDFRMLDDSRDRARMTQAANVAGAILCDDAVAAVLPDAFILPPEPPLQQLNRPGLMGPIMHGLATAVLEAPGPVRRAALRRMFGAERLLDRRNGKAPFSDELVRKSATPMFHVAGTCAMGADTDAAAVVDPHCRVRGVEGLRVVDASVMPVVPRANTNIPTIMVAERASALIREGQR